MSKELPVRDLPTHALKLDSGAIKVQRNFPNLQTPYEKEDIPDYLAVVDHGLAISDEKRYKHSLRDQETELNHLVRKMKNDGRSLIVVFQGRDGSGKSGATVRIIEALDYDMKIFQAVPIGPPTAEELEHPYFWRFLVGDRLPKMGQVRVFDRSWAERVLVERVMSLTKRQHIHASYAQIRTFEWLLAESGAVLVKIWLDITKDEQAKRFKDRAQEKPWKLDPSDEEARKHWHDYTEAANEMFYRSGTDFAPWHLVSSECKHYSRVTVLELINQALRSALL